MNRYLQILAEKYTEKKSHRKRYEPYQGNDSIFSKSKAHPPKKGSTGKIFFKQWHQKDKIKDDNLIFVKLEKLKKKHEFDFLQVEKGLKNKI